MSEWWTYRLSDFLMFAPRTYYRLFALHNADVWPAHVVSILAGCAVLTLLLRPSPVRGHLGAAVLTVAWLWVAWTYFHVRYATIHWAADYIALSFAVQAGLLALIGVLWNGVRFSQKRDWRRWVGMAIFGFGLFAEPLLGLVQGRPMAQAEIFGIAPDPTVIATLGVLIPAERTPWLLLTIPLIWCAYSGATLWVMGAPEAWIPLSAAFVAVMIGTWNAVDPVHRHARGDLDNNNT